MDEDDLSAKSIALKGSHEIPANPKLSSSGDDDAAEDEVEKLIQWAKDAARLERSPSSEEDDDDRATLVMMSAASRERASSGRKKKGRC
jgi:hypothetical protein